MAKLTKEYLKEIRERKTHSGYSAREMLSTSFYNFIHIIRRKFFFTAVELTLRPSKSIKKYLEGYGNYLYSYFNYLLLIGAITIFLSVRYSFFSNDIVVDDRVIPFSSFLDGIGISKQFRVDFFNYANEFATLVNIISIPVFTLCTYVIFGRKNCNLAEHFVLNVYITAQQLLFMWLCVPFIEIWPSAKDEIMQVYFFVSFAYNIWVYVSFFAGGFWLKLLKSLGVSVCAYILVAPVNYLIFYLIRPFIQWVDAIF